MAPVTLTVVPDELTAEVLCGRLRASGIDCSYRRTNIAAAAAAYAGGLTMTGPTDVLVDERDLDDARRLLPADD